MSDDATSTGEVQQVKHTTKLTDCCEVEPEVDIIDSNCPECGQLNPTTIKRVTIERVVPDGGRPRHVVARDYGTNHGLHKTGVDCDSCDWSLTIKDILERIEEGPVSIKGPEYIRRRFSSAGEGHAYFNRGHRISTHLSADEIEEALNGVDCCA